MISVAATPVPWPVASAWYRFFFFWLALWSAIPAVCAEAPVKETDDPLSIKALYLVNFAVYTKWPEASFAHKDSPIQIGILGPDPFGDRLNKAIEAKGRVNGRTLSIHKSGTVDALLKCHLIYFGKMGADQTAQALASLAWQPVLTIGEDTAFIKAGGLISFVNKPDRVWFDVHWPRARERKLEISSQMLRHARETYNK